MGLFDKFVGRKKQTDFEKALKYIQKEYPKQMANFERKLDQTSEIAAKRSSEMDQRLSQMQTQLDEGFARIETAFDNSRTFGSATRTQQTREAQMQASVNEYYKQHPSTPQEDAEAELLLQQIMSQSEGRKR